MKKKTGFNGYIYEFSFDHIIIDASNLIDIHKYLIKKTWYRSFQHDYRYKRIENINKTYLMWGEYQWKYNGTKCKSNQWWNNDKCRC